MKLSVRLTLVFTTFGFVIVSAVAVVSWLLAAQEVRRTVDNDLAARALALKTISQGELDQAARFDPEVERTNPARLGGEGNGGQFFTSTGDLLGDATVPLRQEDLDSLTSGGSPFRIEVVGDRTYRVYLLLLSEFDIELADGRDIAGVQLYRDITTDEEAIASLAVRLAALSVGGLVLAGAGSWFVGRWLADPLQQLTNAAEHLAEFDAPPGRIEVSRSDEIGRLAESFNRMASSLEVGREQQQRLVADASHELRTPLTSLRMRADFLASFDNLDDEHKAIVSGAVVDIEQLTALVTDLVDLATDTRSTNDEPELVRLGDIVSAVAERSSVAADRSIELSTDDSTAVVYPAMIRRAVQNLVDNAIKYGPKNGQITIQVEQQRIEVIDQGPGIPTEDIGYVFDRFFRSPKARFRPGNGIGLAIVKQVAEVHDGHAWAENAASGGARIGFCVATSKT